MAKVAADQRLHQAYVFLREFILGSNPNGTVITSPSAPSSAVSVVGGEFATLAGDYLPGGSAIFFGSFSTQGSTVWPTATVKQWDEFIQTAVPHPGVTLLPGEAGETSLSGAKTHRTTSGWTVLLLVMLHVVFGVAIGLRIV